MPGAAFLEGEEVNLRTVEEEDLEFIRDTFNMPEVWKNLDLDRPQNLEQERDFFENVICEEKPVNLAISVDEKMIGLISIHEKDCDSVGEIGIWIHPDYHGEGYGTEASEILIDYAFDELRFHKIFTRAYESNEGSQRVWEKLGFTQEGELREQVYREGEHENVYCYGLLEEERN